MLSLLCLTTCLLVTQLQQAHAKRLLAYAVADLYVGAMQQGLDFGFSDEQVSTLVGICKAVHTSAEAERRALEAAVKHCNRLLLEHSIDRPPQSVAVFSLQDMRRAAAWFSSSYFMHYSMYQYVFTPQVTLNFTAKDPRKLVEVPTALPPLQDALEEAEHAAQQAAANERRAQAAAEALVEARPTSLRRVLAGMAIVLAMRALAIASALSIKIALGTRP